MGHLNSFSASGGGNLDKNFPKIQMPGGLPGGMFKLRFDWYINLIETKGQFDRSKDCFDRRVNDDKNYSLLNAYIHCTCRLFFVLLSTAKLKLNTYF